MPGLLTPQRHVWLQCGLVCRVVVVGVVVVVKLIVACPSCEAWTPPLRTALWATTTTTQLDMSPPPIGILFGTSTGSTQTAAEKIYQAFGGGGGTNDPSIVTCAEPVDVDTLEKGQLEQYLAQYTALVVGTPTWNTGADTERSGTGWDELYYSTLPKLKSVLKGKKVAVFGLGDQVSYAENYADATGELFDVFESLGCTMLGAWSQDGYEHEGSKSIRGDKFCGLLLDMVNQEDLTDERVEKWVSQLLDEGILDINGVSASVASPSVAKTTDVVSVDSPVNGDRIPLQHMDTRELGKRLDKTSSSNSNQHVDIQFPEGFVPYTNRAGITMWVSRDGMKSYTDDSPIPPMLLRL
jgi:flavodoxin I